MEVKIAENLKIEAAIPLLNIERLQLHWRPNEHAVLSLEGYINNKIPYHLEQLYNSRFTLIMKQNKSEQCLFCGYIIKVECHTVARMEKVYLHVLSASCVLDRQEISRSFQLIEGTYSETVRQAVESSGGKVICVKGRDTKLSKPLIQYEETTWQFAKRLASHLNSSIIPDIETGNPSLWFGMRKGKEISHFSAEQYTVIVKHNYQRNDFNEISYQVVSKEFYKIGDQTSFLNEHMIIVGVSAYIEKGELFFSYLLQKNYIVDPIYQNKFAGLSLPGTILDTKDEFIKVALGIDNNASTGNYYYPWYPITGNALYAMPEKGAKIELYFPNHDERNGFISECTPENKKKYKYQDRCFVLEDGNFIQLFENLLNFSKGGNQSVALSDGLVSAGTTKLLQLSAGGKVRMRANRIQIYSDDEISVYKS